MLRAITLLLAGALLIPGDFVRGGNAVRLMLFPLRAEKVSKKAAAQIESALRGALAGDGQIEIVDAPIGKGSAAIRHKDGIADAALISQIAAASNASKAIACSLVRDGDGYRIELALIDVTSAAAEYTTIEGAAEIEELKKKAPEPAARALLFLKGVPCRVGDCRATRGTLPDGVRLEWNAEGPCGRYYVYRAPAESGEYMKIGESWRPQYEDAGAAPGVRYWYRIAPSPEGPENGTSAVYGYRRPPQPRRLELDELLASKKAPPEAFATKEEEQKSLREREILARFYMNPIKLRLTIFLARSYLSQGKLIILRDFDGYRLDPASMEAVFTRAEPACTVRFKSKRLFTLYAAAGPELFDRLMKNATLFCVHTGDAETAAADGSTLMTPEFAAVGMSTEYLRDDREWSERTIMLGSDDRDYKEKIKQASEAAE